MNKEFAVHMLNDLGKTKAQFIAQAFDECLERLTAHCPPGREMALVRTKLEEACFFAKKSMAQVDENQEDDDEPTRASSPHAIASKA